MTDQQLIRRFTELAEERDPGPQLRGFVAGIPMAILLGGGGESGAAAMRQLLDDVVRIWCEVKAEAQLA